MTERLSLGDWEQWQVEWQRVGNADAAARGAGRQIGRARFELLVTRVIEGAVAVVATLVTALALWHAGNPFEAGLGLVVGVSIGALWIQRMRLREREDAAVAASSPQHLTVLASVRLRQVRLAHFIWIVLVLELVFLTPWWVIGSRVHHRSFTDLVSWETVWLPIAGMVALFVWAWRLRQRTRADLWAIERLREQYRET
jgi:hypothetical protein